MYICIDRAVSGARASLPTLCPGLPSCHDCNNSPFLPTPSALRAQAPQPQPEQTAAGEQLLPLERSYSPGGCTVPKPYLQSQAQGKGSLSSKVRRLSALLYCQTLK